MVNVSLAGFEKAAGYLSQYAARGDQPPEIQKLLGVADKYGLKIGGPSELGCKRNGENFRSKDAQ